MSVLLSPEPQLTSPAPGAADALSHADLAHLLAEFAADLDSWRPLVQQFPERRWWTPLVRNGLVDVWLITWPALQSVDLHDHGASTAALTVVEGRLEHVLASQGGELSTETLAPGTLLTVEPRAVHDVRNAGAVPAVSIHAYSPPLAKMTFYEREPGRLRPLRTVFTDEPEIEANIEAKEEKP